MSRTTIEIAATPERVWAVLSDAPSYGEWVVGTKEIAHADPDWPAPGSALEYELGVGPFTVGDRTVVVEADAPRLLLLSAEMKRLGSISIRLELERVGAATRLTFDEEPVSGIVGAVPTPVSDAALAFRNEEALDRLKRLAETST